MLHTGTVAPPQSLIPIFLPPNSTKALPWIQDFINCGLLPASSNIRRSQRSPRTLRGLSATTPSISEYLNHVINDTFNTIIQNFYFVLVQHIYSSIKMSSTRGLLYLFKPMRYNNDSPFAIESFISIFASQRFSILLDNHLLYSYCKRHSNTIFHVIRSNKRRTLLTYVVYLLTRSLHAAIRMHIKPVQLVPAFIQYWHQLRLGSCSINGPETPGSNKRPYTKTSKYF